MARVVVQGAELADDRIVRLKIRMGSLPERVVDRDTVVAWMRDGHPFLPRRGTSVGRALQLIEVDGEYFVRDDHQAVAGDLLNDVPAI